MPSRVELQADDSQIEDVMERLGVGKFQWFIVIVVNGIWIADGIEMMNASLLTQHAAKDLGIPDQQRSLLVALCYMGLFVGSGVSGYIGDSFGRRIAILASYLGTCCSCVGMIHATGLQMFATFRFCVGLSIGLGMPASLALANELLPPSWRVFAQGMRNVINGLGHVFSITVILFIDPDLKDIEWRSAILCGMVPPLVFGALAACCLPESPLWLASIGREREATAVLDLIRQQNGQPDVDINFAPPVPSDASGETGRQEKDVDWSRQLASLFGPSMLYVTLSVSFASLALNFVDSGIHYAEPLVFPETAETVSAGWQIFWKDLLMIPIRMTIIVPAILLGRKGSMVAVTCLIVTGLLLFAWSASIEGRGVLAEIAYLGSVYLPVIGLSLGYLQIYLISVDIYPTLAAATGGAICLLSGRVGSVSAPFAFELMPGDWRNFYYLAAALALVAMVLLLPARLEGNGGGGDVTAGLLAEKSGPSGLERGESKVPSYSAVG